MPSNWLAVGPETDPLSRARELQRSWERLLADGALGLELPPGATAGLRPTIVESWRRSLATGLDPTDMLAPIEADESEVLERWFEHPLGSLAQDLVEQLHKVAEESRSMVVVTDASGLILHRVGDRSLKERAAEMNLVEGARYSEAADGTNGIGTALAADHAFQVFAFEHFNERHHQWVCSGAPVHDPVTGRVVALVDLSSLWHTAHPRSLELVSAAARSMERRLLEVRRDQDARVRRRYSDLMTRSTDLLVNRDGYVVAGEPGSSEPLELPEGDGEVVLGDGSVAVAASLGQGEAYLLRRVATHHAKSAPVEVLERAERHVRELVTEQAALRQVATLVARESSPDQLFAAVAKQVARVFDVPHVRLIRYDPEGSLVVAGFSEGDREPFPIGSRWALDSPGVTTTVRQTGRPARVEDYAHMTGEIAAVVRGAGMRSTVASPIVVERRLWGAVVVLSPRTEPFPEDTEARLTDFTELVATAIANAESRAAVSRLADEQAALRRVAVLVAQQPSPDEVFAAVTQAVGLLLDADLAVLHVFPGDGTATTVASWGSDAPILPVGSRFPLDGDNLAARIFESGAPARMHSYDEAWKGAATNLARTLRVRSAVGAPVIVEGKLWGALMAATREVGPWAENAETRIGAFTELVATAIANAESREARAVLAEEQAALRRVATLVAQGASPQDLFEAVAEEVGRLLAAASATIGRFEPDDSVTTLASWSATGTAFPTGRRWPTEGKNIAWMVLQTGRSARRDDFSDATDPIGVSARETGVKSAVGTPIVVEGHLWGLVTAASTEWLMPPDTEDRLMKFTELVATAIANAEGKSELAASRRRIVAASDETRRQIERDLHDGTQQRLVSLGLAVRAAEATVSPEREDLREELSRVAEGLAEAVEDLQEISRGIHPAILTKGGLGPALQTLAHRSPIPVGLNITMDARLPEPIEVAAYFVASETLANAAKHSQASRIDLSLSESDGSLELSVRDDGVGGADAARGSGLVGLTDRVEALGGSIRVDSLPGKGTKITAELPLELELSPGAFPAADPKRR
jgi:signal transduction histidine kinase/putative methionine-R-sulfoxide reductase with GAF domain